MLGKKSYRFELSHNSSIKDTEIGNAFELINYVIEENQRLTEENQVGKLIIRKFMDTKNSETLLFAQHLELPVSENTNFDELLEAFYTKKPLSFDPHLIDDDLFKDDFSENAPETMDTVSDEDDYAAAPVIDDSDEELSDMEEQPPLAEVENSAPDNGRDEHHTKINAPASTALTEEAIKEIVAKQMKEKDQEIERLKHDLQNQESQKSLESINITQNDESTSKAFVTPPDSSDIFEDANVLDVIQMVKTEANKRLNDFIAQETTKINAEIEALDTRDKIEPSLTKRFEDEKANKAEGLNKKVDAEKEKAIAAENARHEAALQNIQVELEASRSKQLVALKEEFANKLSVAIKEEYDRQTEQLNLILQGKTEELQLRQKAVNEGMKNTVAEVLDGFNTNHGEVIQTVERRKNSSSLISLHKRVG